MILRASERRIKALQLQAEDLFIFSTFAESCLHRDVREGYLRADPAQAQIVLKNLEQSFDETLGAFDLAFREAMRNCWYNRARSLLRHAQSDCDTWFKVAFMALTRPGGEREQS
jgi:hypothetical protein